MRAAVAARSQEEETIVKVLLINGSPRWKGNTNRALEEAAAALEAEGVQTELVWIGNKEIRGCIACGICGKTGDKHCVFAEDCCNELIAKAAECDGFIVGSPVYYAGMAGSLRALMDRMFYAGGSLDLATQQSAMWTDCDTSDAGDAIVLMRAVKDVMYALVNSNAMNAEVIGYNPPIWQEYLHWINIGAFTLVGVWLVLAIVRTVRCNKRQKAKFAAANAAK